MILYCDTCGDYVRESPFNHREFCKDCFNMNIDDQCSLKIKRLYFPKLWKRRQTTKS